MAKIEQRTNSLISSLLHHSLFLMTMVTWCLLARHVWLKNEIKRGSIHTLKKCKLWPSRNSGLTVSPTSVALHERNKIATLKFLCDPKLIN